MSKPTIKEVLVLVNQARKIMGRKPLDKMPKGHLECIGGDCPIGIATGFAMLDETAYINYHMNTVKINKLCAMWNISPMETLGRSIDLPPILRRFVKYFDNGEYPSLIAPKKNVEAWINE